jgi:hypothetical protein
MLGALLLQVALAWPGFAVPPEPPATPVATAAATGARKEAYEPQPGDVVTVGDWPAIGKWMLDRHLRPAAWLAARVQGKTLREPINVVLIDTVAASAQGAVVRLLRACREAGYTAREGHSSGYRGYIGGVLFEQLPVGRGRAFANEPFELHNNHGRIFGPFRFKDGWLFIAALSREKFDPITKTEHVFVSFNRAREDFARKLDAATRYKLVGHVELGNALGGDTAVTTADHDGKAVLLRAQK